jgi:hypothetical protein
VPVLLLNLLGLSTVLPMTLPLVLLLVLLLGLLMVLWTVSPSGSTL